MGLEMRRCPMGLRLLKRPKMGPERSTRLAWLGWLEWCGGILVRPWLVLAWLMWPMWLVWPE